MQLVSQLVFQLNLFTSKIHNIIAFVELLFNKFSLKFTISNNYSLTAWSEPPEWFGKLKWIFLCWSILPIRATIMRSRFQFQKRCGVELRGLGLVILACIIPNSVCLPQYNSYSSDNISRQTFYMSENQQYSILMSKIETYHSGQWFYTRSDVAT